MKFEAHPLANIGQKRRGKPLPTNVNQLNPKNAINLSATDEVVTKKTNVLAKTAALADPGRYQIFSGFLTGSGDEANLYPIPVAAREILCIQVDLPNNAQIDYDAYLYEIGTNNSLTLVDASEYVTYTNNINGPSGTVPEGVGVYNTSNTTKNYLLSVYSYQGGSSTLPFRIHVGIRANNAPLDSRESDEHAHKATSFNLDVPNPSINFRAANTLCDNDWFTFTSPASIVFNSILITLDTASVNAGYKLEVYYPASNGGLRKALTTIDGRFPIGLNTAYYIRVTSTGATSLTGANYTFTLYPDYYVNNITITGYEGGEYATYCPGSYPTYNRYRVRGGGQITVNGIVRYKIQNNAIVVPNTSVKFTFYNPHYNSIYNGEMSTTVTSNSSGVFSATLPVGPARGNNYCSFGSATTFTHTYDINDFTLESGPWGFQRSEVFLLATDGQYW